MAASRGGWAERLLLAVPRARIAGRRGSGLRLHAGGARPRRSARLALTFAAEFHGLSSAQVLRCSGAQDSVDAAQQPRRRGGRAIAQLVRQQILRDVLETDRT